MKSGFLNFRMIAGCGGLVAWLLVFSAGLLVETIEQRRYFAPQFYADQPPPAGMTPIDPGSATRAFLVATFCYIPTNLVILALLASLVGGCASNAYVENMSDDQRAEVGSRRRMYLEESPWAAMTRGFIVYLCVIAGLYFVVDEPFKVTTPPQYARLAGMISFLAVVVGFDPTQIDYWIRLGRNALPTRGDQPPTPTGGDGGAEETAGAARRNPPK